MEHLMQGRRFSDNITPGNVEPHTALGGSLAVVEGAVAVGLVRGAGNAEDLADFSLRIDVGVGKKPCSDLLGHQVALAGEKSSRANKDTCHRI